MVKEVPNWPRGPSQSRYGNASGVRKADSTSSPSRAVSVDRFFTTPYSPKLQARVSETQSPCQLPAEITSTPSSTMPPPTRAPVPSRSRNSSTPNNTLTRGLMK